ncbi:MULTISPECIES: hypothetical protein [Terrabacteria group]|uniref:hypothetical protein n=1 Tax=Bacillati TaxID=1783272 RepID=UPI00193972A8|nr:MULTISPECIES: hypothetical protein [Terrabacteria group]MBW9211891.1 hypothetical protein [Trueperella sp. zg.1013]QRG87306.1 hypothetical protein JOS54_03080 [Bulleidia sp. zg-1006]
MIKKIQNLLFEDEIPEELENETVEKEEEKASVVEKIAEPIAPVQEKKVVTPVVPVEEEKIVETPKPSFPNITIDDKKASAPAKRMKKESRKVSETKSFDYKFQPVISPIFGANEKDVDALKSTASKLNEKEKKKHMENVTTILSPMWGSEGNNPIHNVKEEVKETPSSVLLNDSQIDDEIPEFSLDDILNERDKVYGKVSAGDTMYDSESGVFPQLNLFDDELEDAEDSTTVIKKTMKH